MRLLIQLQSHLWHEQERGEKTRMNSCLFCQPKVPGDKGLASCFGSNGIEEMGHPLLCSQQT